MKHERNSSFPFPFYNTPRGSLIIYRKLFASSDLILAQCTSPAQDHRIAKLTFLLNASESSQRGSRKLPDADKTTSHSSFQGASVGDFFARQVTLQEPYVAGS